MKLDVRATKIDENSEFARYFAKEAGDAFPGQWREQTHLQQIMPMR